MRRLEVKLASLWFAIVSALHPNFQRNRAKDVPLQGLDQLKARISLGP